MTRGAFDLPRRQEAPRRVRGGLKLRGETPVHDHWVSRRWLALVEAAVPAEAGMDGLEYARRGQVTDLVISPGRLAAHVQGRAPSPYRTAWRAPVFDEAEWARIVEAMAAEALYGAKLLAGEFPDAVADLFAAAGLALIPASEEFVAECTCPEPVPCKHAAALGYLAVESLDRDPMGVLTFRGCPNLLERLTAARAIRTHGHATAHAEPVVGAAPSGPLAGDLERFWRPGAELARLREMPPPHHAPHALLRRLGPSPLDGRFPLMGLLASIYDTVAEAAIKLRNEAEGLE